MMFVKRLLACVALFFSVPSLIPLAAAQDKGTREKIRITYASNSLAFLVTFIAKDRGFYSKNGLETELVQVRPSIAIAALLSGDADYAEVLGSAIRSAAKGAPLRAISTTIGAPFFSIAARPQFKDVRELKGRSIGITAIGGTNYISTRMLLQHFGIDPEREVKILAIGDEKLVYEAIKIGRVDAVTVAPPFSVLLKREGFPLLAHTAGVLSIPFVGLSATAQKISQSRAQVKRVLKAEIEALRYVRSDARGSVEVIRKRFAMDEPMARESYQVVVDAFSHDGRIPRQGVNNLLDLEKKDGFIPMSVTADQVVDFSLVEEALKDLGG